MIINEDSNNITMKQQRFSAELRAGHMTSVFRRHPCCRDRACTEQIVKVYKTPERAMRDPKFMQGLRVFAWTFRFCNMTAERYLAALRRALDGMAGEEVEGIGRLMNGAPHSMC